MIHSPRFSVVASCFEETARIRHFVNYLMRVLIGRMHTYTVYSEAWFVLEVYRLI